MNARKLFSTTAAMLLGVTSIASAQAQPIVAQKPTMSATQVAFTMGGEVWLVDRAGGAARRVTSGAQAPVNGGNAFSPDGKLLAYTARYGGDADVYVIPVAGGQPKRLTFSGEPDEVVGWSADGLSILFRSTRDTYYPGYGLPRVYAVAVGGGPARPLPFPIAYSAALSPDGTQAAVEPQQYINISWKHYRGGDQRRLLLVDLRSLAERPLPGTGGNDHDPAWVDGKLYFISDRDGRSTLYSFDPESQAVTRLFDPGEWDVKHASGGPGGIVFTQLNGISIFDIATGSVRPLAVTPIGDMPGAASASSDLSKQIFDAAVSDTGEVALEARGRIVVANARGALTVFGGSDHMERAPAFAAPGKVTAFSDASGTNQLVVHDTVTRGETQPFRIAGSGYFRVPTWSRDGRRLAYMDLLQNIWVARPGSPPLQIDTERKLVPIMGWNTWDAVWSDDGQELAYSRTMDNGLFAVFIWSAADGKVRQVTPGDVDSKNPAWDADGKRLWFTASNNTPPAGAYLDQTDKMRPAAVRSVFSITREGGRWSDPRPLGLPAQRYEGLFAQKSSGKLLLLETIIPVGSATFSTAGTQTLHAADADAATPVQKVIAERIEGIYPGELHGRFTTSVRVSSDRSKVVYRAGGTWTVATVDGLTATDQRTLSLTEARVTTNPRQEWQQMFGDTMRQLTYLFHDPTHPPHDFAAWRARYEPLVAGIGSRQDLTYVQEDILGELHLSHADVNEGRGDDEGSRPATGTLAADMRIDGGRYRITRIYHAPMFGADAVSPLDEPALRAVPGDWIVSIAGRPVSADRDITEYLQETAGRSTPVCLSNGRKGGERCAEVKPLANDASLRFASWLSERREMVHRLSGGRIGYIHSSDTVETGLAEFNQARYALHDREGFIVDVRFNSGGFAADYFVGTLTAPLLSRWQMPEGRTATTPFPLLDGPKAMITNAYCGSGCDTYAYYFKQLGIGPLVGTPTWGGVSSSGGPPIMMDGGWITTPQYAMTDPQGHYDLEGKAVQPTIPVNYPLRDMAAGRDPQLERAVAEVVGKLGPRIEQ
jgi:tricorn protease